MARERTGSIVNRKGVLFARVSYVDSTGKRREITRKAADRADARRIIDELHDRLDQHGGEAVLNDRSTLTDIIELYRQEKAIPAVIRDGRKIAGLKSHYTVGLCLDVISAHLGRKKLRDIRPADLHAFKKKRLATPTQYGRDRTVAATNRELEVLRSVCRWCVAQGWLARSPFTYGEAVIIKSHEASRDRVLSHTEETALLNACTGRRAYLRGIVVMALDTAMRRGEILKLTWPMVNMAQGVVNLPGEVTKTGKPRTVPLTPRVLSELDTQAKERQAHGKTAPGKAKTLMENLPQAFGAARDHAAKAVGDLVFNVVNFRFVWEAVCEEAKLDGFRFHDCRHTAITRLIAAGVNPALVMKISGHDSMKTFQRYLNPEASTLREVAERLHDLNVVEWDRAEDQGGEYVN